MKDLSALVLCLWLLEGCLDPVIVSGLQMFQDICKMGGWMMDGQVWEREASGRLSPGKSRDGFGNVSFCLSDLQMEMSQWLIMYESGAWREGQGLTERWD